MEIRAVRQHRSIQERRQIVEETLRPGASVSKVARAHDVNTNLVFTWRRLYRQGLLEAKEDSGLVPVKISGGMGKSLVARGRSSKAAASTAASGTIEIDLGHARVRIEGAADPDCVRAALEGLVR